MPKPSDSQAIKHSLIYCLGEPKEILWLFQKQLRKPVKSCADRHLQMVTMRIFTFVKWTLAPRSFSEVSLSVETALS